MKKVDSLLPIDIKNEDVDQFSKTGSDSELLKAKSAEIRAV